MPKQYTPQELLALPMEPNDAGADTIGQYLATLTATVWHYGEDFSGKRPFGNSDWQSDIPHALVKEGAVEGEITDGGWMAGHDLGEIGLKMKEMLDFIRAADWNTLQLPPQPKDWVVIAINPGREEVAHHVTVMLDEASAKATVESHNKTATDWKWTAIRLPM